MNTMKRAIIFLVLLVPLLTSCSFASYKIDRFIMDYPHGEQRIMVERSGKAFLYYGSRASFKTIKKNTFSIDKLYKVFKNNMHANVPREEWPNPKSKAGMITLVYKDGTDEDFLIFDMPEVTQKIFDKAKENKSKDILGEDLMPEVMIH